ncbi:MAG: tRNA (N6-threonylcarbamoyladenosine(37)-N6)-methyltransferase TrmO [Anaerolineae bacterium]|nr:tRNA (N6-threonylcarbamoyladenosine(37)-N6)-methyltransferase TrmO [Anaerolineae bacterium]
MPDIDYTLHPIGVIHSELKLRKGAPRQGYEGAPDALIDIEPAFSEALEGISVGDTVIILTWLHQSVRDVLQVHPRGEIHNPAKGVFATRSPDRPNPIGLHRVTVLEMDGRTLKVGPIEAIDGTPVVDIKPVLSQSADS